MLGGVSLDMAYGPDNQGAGAGSFMDDTVDNRPSFQNNQQQQQQQPQQNLNQHFEQKEKSTYINKKQNQSQEDQQYQLQQMLMQQKLKNNKKKKIDYDDDEPSFMDKLKMKKSEIGKFLTLCGILIIALGYDKFLKLSIAKISDKYDFTESQKYYLIFAVPTILLLIIIYLMTA